MYCTIPRAVHQPCIHYQYTISSMSFLNNRSLIIVSFLQGYRILVFYFFLSDVKPQPHSLESQTSNSGLFPETLWIGSVLLALLLGFMTKK